MFNVVCVQTAPVSWPPGFARRVRCQQGYGLAVDAARGLVVVSAFDADMSLGVYPLAGGPLLRKLGGSGSGPGQFSWRLGGLCLTPSGTVLVAEALNRRVQEVNVDDGSHVRYVGAGVLTSPEYVDCNDRVIASRCCRGWMGPFWRGWAAVEEVVVATSVVSTAC